MAFLVQQRNMRKRFLIASCKRENILVVTQQEARNLCLNLYRNFVPSVERKDPPVSFIDLRNSMGL
jgi:hypothetical protein